MLFLNIECIPGPSRTISRYWVVENDESTDYDDRIIAIVVDDAKQAEAWLDENTYATGAGFWLLNPGL